MYDLTVDDKNPRKSRTSDMNTRDIGIITEGGYINNIILKTYDGFVSLSDPSVTWNSDPNVSVRLLKPGQKVILEIKGEE